MTAVTRSRIRADWVSLTVLRHQVNWGWGPARSLMTIVPHAPRGNAVRDALRHTAVFLFQVDWGAAQVTFSPLGESL